MGNGRVSSSPLAWTVRSIVQWIADDLARRGIDTARLDAELLVAEALGTDRLRLYMDLDRPLVEQERGRVRELVTRRRAREPMAYILGEKEFYGRRFRVSPAVLVPRPDTETLIERALDKLEEDAAAHVLDLGTGSGAIAVTLAFERPHSTVDAVDISNEALEVARFNAERYGVSSRVRFCQGDLYEPLPEGRSYSLVVSNPPYIASADLPGLQPEIRDHEPKLALDGGTDGLAFHRRIIASAPTCLEPGGVLMMELGDEQSEAVSALFDASAWREVRFHCDLRGTPRVVQSSM